MDLTHYHALLVGYVTAIIGWLIICRLAPALWPKSEPIAFPRPWLEVLAAMIAAAVVIGVGTLYSAKRLLPTQGQFASAMESINQALIFSPMIALLVIRRHSLATAWLPTKSIPARVIVGIALACLAVAAFSTVHRNADSWPRVMGRISQPKNVSYFVQVFLEDMTIAILFVRLRAALGFWPPLVLVAVLFAAGHIPALLSMGIESNELLSLFLDAGLGVVVLAVLQRAQDIWWFCWVHFAMDIMQFASIAQPAGAAS